MKKKEVKKVGELSEEHRNLISWAINELEVVHMLGKLLSLNEKQDVAFVGGVIMTQWTGVRREFNKLVAPTQDDDLPF